MSLVWVWMVAKVECVTILHQCETTKLQWKSAKQAGGWCGLWDLRGRGERLGVFVEGLEDCWMDLEETEIGRDVDEELDSWGKGLCGKTRLKSRGIGGKS